MDGDLLNGRVRRQLGIAWVPLIIVVGLCILVIIFLPFGGGGVKSYSLAGPATIAVGSTGTYSVTLTLDGPAGLTWGQKTRYAFSGVLPPPPTWHFDLVEADNGWDDTLANDVSITVPFGATSMTVATTITCVSATVVKGISGSSDSEPTQQLRSEGWNGLLPVESNIVTLTCTPSTPTTGTGGTVGGTSGTTTGGTGSQCAGSCGANHTAPITISLPCPEICQYDPDNLQMRLGMRLVETEALNQANGQCTGANCSCGITSSSSRFSNCHAENGKCVIDVTVSLGGVCRTH